MSSVIGVTSSHINQDKSGNLDTGKYSWKSERKAFNRPENLLSGHALQ
jgi:hypothetical protein